MQLHILLLKSIANTIYQYFSLFITFSNVHFSTVSMNKVNNLLSKNGKTDVVYNYLILMSNSDHEFILRSEPF